MDNPSSGHWFPNVVWWSNNSGKGSTINSLQNNFTEEKVDIKNRIIKLFGNNANLSWEDMPCISQSQLECCPRILWSVLILSKFNGTLENIESGITQITHMMEFNGNNSANEIRQTVLDIYNSNLPVNTEAINIDSEVTIIS